MYVILALKLYFCSYLCYLFFNRFNGGSALAVSAEGAVFEVYCVKNVLLERIGKLFKLAEGKFFKHGAVIYTVGNKGTRNFISRSEGYALFCKIVGKVGSVDKALCGGVKHILL